MTTVKINNAAVIIPFTDDRRVLLQRKDLGYKWNPGQWCFFGGKIEDGEDCLECVNREMTEELGLALENISFFGERQYFDIAPYTGDRREGVLQVYTGRFDGNLSRIRLNEGAGMSLWAEEEILPLNMVPCNKETLMEFYRSLRK